MPPLVDTDIFCKLGTTGLLEQALSLFGARVAECGRLPALPHMLQRGQLVKLYGEAACTALLPIASAMPTVPAPPSEWLGRLVNVPLIDPGEAQLFSCAAAGSLVILTGDKRALRALAGVEGFADALAGRIVTLEALLLALCSALGDPAVRSMVQPLASGNRPDQTIKICFSSSNEDPRTALLSYFNALKHEVQPLILWEPPTEESA